jgi:Flp pilus assembly protein protease CpaA
VLLPFVTRDQLGGDSRMFGFLLAVMGVGSAVMPVSMALAGPAASALPIWLIFLVAGGVYPVVAVVALLVARMSTDEIAHPLDRQGALSAGAEATSGPRVP